MLTEGISSVDEVGKNRVPIMFGQCCCWVRCKAQSPNRSERTARCKHEPRHPFQESGVLLTQFSNVLAPQLRADVRQCSTWGFGDNLVDSRMHTLHGTLSCKHQSEGGDQFSKFLALRAEQRNACEPQVPLAGNGFLEESATYGMIPYRAARIQLPRSTYTFPALPCLLLARVSQSAEIPRWRIPEVQFH